jgi:hypothetical protein
LRERITLAGVIAIEVSMGGTVTVLTFEVMVPRVAVIEIAVLLLVKSLARPGAPMLTTAGLDETQATDEVIVCVVPLL